MHPPGYTWSKEYLEQLFNRLNMFPVDKTSERHHLTGTNNKTWLVQFSTANVNSQRKASGCLPNTQIEKKKKSKNKICIGVMLKLKVVE